VRIYCFPLCDWLSKNAVTFVALSSVMFFLSILQTSSLYFLQNYIFGSVQNINDCHIVLDSAGDVMTPVRLAEELDYEFKQDSVVRIA